MSLWADFVGNTHGRSAYKGSHYFDAYESHLARFRGRSVTMIEIGVFKGGSLEMWKRYLGPSAQIVGLDIDPACREYEAPQIAVRIGDQADAGFLQAVVDEFGPIDIVLDDGSHMPSDIAKSFETLYPQLDRNGVYIVEDTGTSYLSAWNGGVGREGTFIEAVKGRIDELHADYSSELEPTLFSRMTRSLHVYQALVVFERGRHVDKRGIQTRPDKIRLEGRGRPVSGVPPMVTGRDLYLDLLGRGLLGLLDREPRSVEEREDGTVEVVPLRKPGLRRYGRDWPATAETMIGELRLENVRACVEDVLRDGVPGDLIETGVWRGGTTVFMRGVLAAYGVTDRRVWVADSFAGLPEPDAAAYPADAGNRLHAQSFLAVSEQEVRETFRRYDLLDEQVKFLPGWFRDTLPTIGDDERFAVARLDGDLYESTMVALEHLYPRLSVGGYVIVDDYGALPICAQAVDDYRDRHGIQEPIVKVDWSGAFWRKEHRLRETVAADSRRD